VNSPGLLPVDETGSEHSRGTSESRDISKSPDYAGAIGRTTVTEPSPPQPTPVLPSPTINDVSEAPSNRNLAVSSSGDRGHPPRPTGKGIQQSSRHTEISSASGILQAPGMSTQGFVAPLSLILARGPYGNMINIPSGGASPCRDSMLRLPAHFSQGQSSSGRPIERTSSSPGFWHELKQFCARLLKKCWAGLRCCARLLKQCCASLLKCC
jgi:hypothetical protein